MIFHIYLEKEQKSILQVKFLHDFHLLLVNSEECIQNL